MPKPQTGKPIRVRDSTKAILDQLKIDSNAREYDQVIRHLIKTSKWAQELLKRPKVKLDG